MKRVVQTVTCENPHGTVDLVGIPLGDHHHEEAEEIRPGIGPVPVGDGWDGVGHAGPHLADGLAQPGGQPATDMGLGLQTKTMSLMACLMFFWN